jgi:outer membrane protein
MQLTRILCTLYFACVLTMAAEDPSAKDKSITLQESIQMALENNLDVKIRRFDPTIAQYNLSGSYAAYEPLFGLFGQHSFNSQPGGFDTFGRALPAREIESDDFGTNPQLSGMLPTGTGLRYNGGFSMNESTFNSTNVSHSGNWSIGLTQPLLKDSWIDGGRMQIQVSKKALKMSELDLQQQIMVTINSVEQAYYNLIYARESVKVQEKALELVQRFLVETRKKVEVGALAQLEEKQAESQVATSKADLLSAQRSLALQENVLKSLITPDFAGWQDVHLVPGENLVPLPMSYNLQDSWRKGLTQRPDLQRFKLDLERRDIVLRYRKNQLLPELDLIGSYGHNGLNTSFDRVFDDLGTDQNPRWSYGARLSIPLGNISARNNYKAEKAAKQQALLQLKKLEKDIMVQIDDAIKQAQTNFERVEATKQARLFAEAALDAEQKKLENGKGTPFFVLQFQRNLTSARFEEIRGLAEYNNALAQLAYLEGATLERHRINISLK